MKAFAAKSVHDLKEVLETIDVSLGTLARQIPDLTAHPTFKLIRYQLACALVDDPQEIPESHKLLPEQTQ